jgi:hypothetical protein
MSSPKAALTIGGGVKHKVPYASISPSIFTGRRPTSTTLKRPRRVPGRQRRKFLGRFTLDSQLTADIERSGMLDLRLSEGRPDARALRVDLGRRHPRLEHHRLAQRENDAQHRSPSWPERSTARATTCASGLCNKHGLLLQSATGLFLPSAAATANSIIHCAR